MAPNSVKAPAAVRTAGTDKGASSAPRPAWRSPCAAAPRRRRRAPGRAGLRAPAGLPGRDLARLDRVADQEDAAERQGGARRPRPPSACRARSRCRARRACPAPRRPKQPAPPRRRSMDPRALRPERNRVGRRLRRRDRSGVGVRAPASAFAASSGCNGFRGDLRFGWRRGGRPLRLPATPPATGSSPAAFASNT